MQTVVLEKRGGHWTANFEGHPELGFRGDHPVIALSRLLESLDNFDPNSLIAVEERTTDDRLVFIIGEECPDCGGSGQYVGLNEISACSRCDGNGRV